MRRSGCALLLVCLLVAGAEAAVVTERTDRVSSPIGTTRSDGDSGRPSINREATLVAFDSVATRLTADANGSVRDVFVRDLRTKRTSLVSTAVDGGPADGPSDAPVIAGSTVVFSSRATNLVPGDANGVRDVFLARPGQPIERVSLTAAGGQANGPSYQQDISADGRRVVFTSLANDLVPGDTNGVEDVFVRDLATGTTRRVSERGGRSLTGRSRAPAISPDGRWVSFESTAADAVPGDRNGVADVFLADLESGRIRRVSVNSREVGQNRAVATAFVTVSDVSVDGRFVAWDSDATNLAAGDRNRDTDVFVRDVRRGRTGLVSRASTGRVGNNDSYLPVISYSGRYVTFSSFAANLWPADRAGEDVFLRDRAYRVTTPLTVTTRGRVRPPETRRQLLRRATFSDFARRIAFSSTAPLSEGDADTVEDVFVRALDAPKGRIVSHRVERRRLRWRLAADDPAARFICRIDRGRPFFCSRSGRSRRLRPGRHRLLVRAGGPGMLFERSASVVGFRVR